jgi:uncharacterized membrane protein
MKIRTFAFFFFFLLLASNFAQIVHYYPLLPERVASHFNFQGVANGWSSKHTFMAIYGVVLVVTTVLLVGLPLLLAKLPPSIINMPNRDYWLAPERKQETCRTVSGYMILVGIAVMALLFTVFHWTIRVNLGYDQQMGSVVWIIVPFFIFITGWCIAFFMRFKKPTA